MSSKPTKPWGYAEAAKIDQIISQALLEHPLDPLEELSTAELQQWLAFTRTVESTISIIQRKLNVGQTYEMSRGFRILDK